MEHQRQRGACIPCKSSDFSRVGLFGFTGEDVDSENFMAFGKQRVPRTVNRRVEREPL